MTINPINSVDTIANLRLATSATLAGTSCYVEGYYAQVDGGEGMFTYIAVATGADNGGTIIVDASSRHWIRAGTAHGVTVDQFGAKGDGTTTAGQATAFQAALTWAGGTTVGGGIVWVPVKNYKFATSDQLLLPSAVTLKGTAVGPFTSFDVTVSSICPLLMITNTSTPFLISDGISAGVEDVGMFWPNQVGSGSATPTAYPFAIQSIKPNPATARGSIGFHVRRVTAFNAYNFLDIEQGRYWVEDCLIGAMNIGVNIDQCEDYGFVDNCYFTVSWDDTPAGNSVPPFPSVLDKWVASHGIAFNISRCDSIKVSNIGIFNRYAAIVFLDSVLIPSGSKSSYGQWSNIDIDTVQYGIYCNSTDSTGAGHIFSNMNIGGLPTGEYTGLSAQAAIITNSGGSDTPLITWNGGGMRGTWAAGFTGCQRNAGKIYASDVIGLNHLGDLGTNSPGVPASGAVFTNPWPFPMRIAIQSNPSGPITSCLVDGVGQGANSTLVILEPQETFEIVYTAAPVLRYAGM